MASKKESLYQPQSLRIADMWRNYYNPLINLRVRLVTAWLFDLQQGIVSNIQWLYRYVERRDPTICALIARRTSAIKKLNWDVKTIPEKELPDGYTVADAEAQAAVLQEMYDKIDNIPEAIEWLALGQFRGYAHLEKHYDGDGEVCHLEPVPQWNWARAGLIGDWAYNRQALQVFYDPDHNSPSQLTPIDTDDFIIREVSHPILEAIIINWLRKGMNQKDWDAFIETYGLPSVFIEVPENAPVGADGKLDPSYLEAAQQVASDSRGVLPPGCKIITVTGGSSAGTHNVFETHIRYIDEQAVLAGTGGLLTMLTKSGSGTLAGAAHKDTFDELAEAEAVEVSAIFNAQLDKQKLDEKFPTQPQLAYFQLEAQEGTDTSKIVDDAANMRTAGFQIDQDQFEEKTGYTVTPYAPPAGPDGVPPKLAKADAGVTNRAFILKGDPWSKVSNRARNEAGELATNAMKKLAPAQAEAFKAVLESFRVEVLNGPDDQIANRWSAFAHKLPAMLKTMNMRPATQKAFYEAFSTGYINGLFVSTKVPVAA